jgi:hypothetical protein
VGARQETAPRADVKIGNLNVGFALFNIFEGEREKMEK